MLDAWRESTRYTERERAALGLCEAMTLITDGHVPDDVWDVAAKAFADEHELAQLVLAIAAINAWNRAITALRIPPGLGAPAAEWHGGPVTSRPPVPSSR